jgi:hypothetical protein
MADEVLNLLFVPLFSRLSPCGFLARLAFRLVDAEPGNSLAIAMGPSELDLAGPSRSNWWKPTTVQSRWNPAPMKHASRSTCPIRSTANTPWTKRPYWRKVQPRRRQTRVATRIIHEVQSVDSVPFSRPHQVDLGNRLPYSYVRWAGLDTGFAAPKWPISEMVIGLQSVAVVGWSPEHPTGECWVCRSGDRPTTE